MIELVESKGKELTIARPTMVMKQLARNQPIQTLVRNTGIQ